MSSLRRKIEKKFLKQFWNKKFILSRNGIIFLLVSQTWKRLLKSFLKTRPIDVTRFCLTDPRCRNYVNLSLSLYKSAWFNQPRKNESDLLLTSIWLIKSGCLFLMNRNSSPVMAISMSFVSSFKLLTVFISMSTQFINVF